MKDYIVLVTEGKHACVDRAYVKLFSKRDEAAAFCILESTGKVKHCTNAEIVYEDEVIELTQPE